MRTKMRKVCFRTLILNLSIFLGLNILLNVVGLQSSSVAWGAELSVESTLDQSPAELKNLNERATLLEKRFGELEQRLMSEQSKIAGNSDSNLVELSLFLSPQLEPESSLNNDRILVSHLRMSLNGRPHIYNQDALFISPDFPIPLYLGLIHTGKHLVRIQFQASNYKGHDEAATRRSWLKMDETFTIDVDDQGTGKFVRNFVIAPTSGRLTVDLQKATK